MGLSIHYKGQLKPDIPLKELIEDVADIAQVHGWPYQVFENEFPKNVEMEMEEKKLYGIVFTPPKSETVSLSFMANRKLVNLSFLESYDPEMDIKEQEYLYMLWTKTQFAGTETHKLIIDLFKYLDKKYFSHFEMQDEGKYWETGDEKVLAENFKRYTMIMDSIENGFNEIPKKEGESVENYIERIWKNIRKK